MSKKSDVFSHDFWHLENFSVNPKGKKAILRKKYFRCFPFSFFLHLESYISNNNAMKQLRDIKSKIFQILQLLDFSDFCKKKKKKIRFSLPLPFTPLVKAQVPHGSSIVE